MGNRIINKIKMIVLIRQMLVPFRSIYEVSLTLGLAGTRADLRRTSTPFYTKSVPPPTLLSQLLSRTRYPTTQNTWTRASSPKACLLPEGAVLRVRSPKLAYKQSLTSTVLFDNAKKQTTEVIDAIREETKSAPPTEGANSKSTYHSPG